MWHGSRKIKNIVNLETSSITASDPTTLILDVFEQQIKTPAHDSSTTIEFKM